MLAAVRCAGVYYKGLLGLPWGGAKMANNSHLSFIYLFIHSLVWIPQFYVLLFQQTKLDLLSYESVSESGILSRISSSFSLVCPGHSYHIVNWPWSWSWFLARVLVSGPESLHPSLVHLFWPVLGLDARLILGYSKSQQKTHMCRPRNIDCFITLHIRS